MITVLVLGFSCFIAAPPSPDSLARVYVSDIRNLNERHKRVPGKTREPQLAKRLSSRARAALKQLLAAKGTPPVHQALVECAEASLELDLLENFQAIRVRLLLSSPEDARSLGLALSRDRFILRGLNGIEEQYLETFARVMAVILDAYQDVFGFAEWSKVPGKKIRVRIHLEVKEKLTPPHFVPQYPFHSEIDFPVEDGSQFRSPTRDGKFLFYGLCHELGHLIAMWGDRRNEEDHHAWAHYTGVTILGDISRASGQPDFLRELRDVQWRSLEAERKAHTKITPSLSGRDGVLALLIALHDRVGPRAIGESINLLDRLNKRLRVNGVRYYTFKELKAALLRVAKKPEEKKAIATLMP
jgi:hypothetical protein